MEEFEKRKVFAKVLRLDKNPPGVQNLIMNFYDMGHDDRQIALNFSKDSIIKNLIFFVDEVVSSIEKLSKAMDLKYSHMHAFCLNSEEENDEDQQKKRRNFAAFVELSKKPKEDQELIMNLYDMGYDDRQIALSTADQKTRKLIHGINSAEDYLRFVDIVVEKQKNFTAYDFAFFASKSPKHVMNMLKLSNYNYNEKSHLAKKENKTVGEEIAEAVKSLSEEKKKISSAHKSAENPGH